MDKNKLYFYMYKDVALKNPNDLKERIKKYDNSINNLYNKIVNYQITKYGEQLISKKQATDTYSCIDKRARLFYK